jgi:hypothetical protein
MLGAGQDGDYKKQRLDTLVALLDLMAQVHRMAAWDRRLLVAWLVV